MLQTAATAPAAPDTEIFLAPLAATTSGVQIDAPVNISNNDGYDNQPAFSPDGASVLFTSVRGGGTQSDIYRYEIGAGRVTRVTDTPEREYSPTPMPDGQHISVVRVEPDGTQRLWQFTSGGKEPTLLLADVKPVGYHVWATDRLLALFVLGDPPTLRLADRTTGRADVLVTGIGRSLQRIPGGRTVSFVVREAGKEPGGAPSLSIHELDPETRQTTLLVGAVPGATEADCVWTPDGWLLMAHDGALHGWRRGASGWTRLVDLQALGLTGVSRMAVSPRGDRIAFVTTASARPAR